MAHLEKAGQIFQLVVRPLGSSWNKGRMIFFQVCRTFILSPFFTCFIFLQLVNYFFRFTSI